MQHLSSHISPPRRRLRLGLVGMAVAAGLVLWGAGMASASSKKKMTARPAVGRIASVDPKVGHLGTPVARASTTKAHRFSRVTPNSKLSGYSIQTASVSVPNDTQVGASAACPTGTVVMGGGAFASSSSVGANINSSYPLTDGSAWNAYEGNTTGSADTLTAYAICAKQPRFYAIVDNSTDNPAETQTFVSVACPAKYKVLGVGAVGTSSDTAVNLNSVSPYKSTHPTRYNTGAYVNNAGTGDDTAYAFAVCGKLKAWSMSSSSGVDNPSGAQTFVDQACPSGTIPTGGGIFASGGLGVNVNATYPYPSIDGWAAYENNATSGDDTISASALCAA